jgi:Helix-turn-helix domain
MSVTETLLADFLTRGEAAAELRVCERTLDRWHALGIGPPRTRIGRTVLYRRASLQNWIVAQERQGSAS